MSSTLILAGLGMAAVGFGGRLLLRHGKQAQQIFKELEKKALPTGPFSNSYKGGFEVKMTKKEASQILGVSPQASAARVKEAHKRIMLLNHPDRGGSPYIATKINEAKDYLESKKR